MRGKLNEILCSYIFHPCFTHFPLHFSQARCLLRTNFMQTSRERFATSCQFHANFSRTLRIKAQQEWVRLVVMSAPLGPARPRRARRRPSLACFSWVGSPGPEEPQLGTRQLGGVTRGRLARPCHARPHTLHRPGGSNLKCKNSCFFL